MEIIVQKYGGTSVGSASRMTSVADIVIQSLHSCQPIVVLSALSGSKKSEGTTSKLLEAVQEVLIPHSQKYLAILDWVQKYHVDTATEAIPNEVIRKEVINDITSELNRLRSFMSAAEIIDEISPRSRDVIVSVGEKLSARIFTGVLKSRGVQARYVNLDTLVTKTFDVKSINQSFYDYLVVRLAETLKPTPSEVLVVTGYLGPVPGSILTTIGRGYTDLTAALIAVALKAQELQIWKEVDGIFTADPRKAPRARKVSSISPEEAAELTYYGSEVIHPFTMEQVIRASIPIRIKNAFKPEGEGTLILPEGQTLSVDPKRSPSFSFKHPTAVTIKDNVVVLNVHSNRKSVSHGFFAETFLTLDKYGIVVDLISTSEVHVSMALNPSVQESTLLPAVEELRKHATVDVIRDLAILSLVGKEMRNMVGIASRMFSTLAKHKVNIEMISQGASEINISCVIEESKADVALIAVHDELILDQSES